MIPFLRGRFVLLLLPALLLLACGTSGSASRNERSATLAPAAPPATVQADPRLPRISFTTASGGRAELGVEIEASDPQREKGLMNVTSLPADQGQIFIFQDLAPNHDVLIPFWMQDTLIPLSIAFVAADGRVQEIQDMEPQTTTYHTPRQPYRYAVEANQGWYARHGVTAGSIADLSAALKGSIPVLTPTATP